MKLFTRTVSLTGAPAEYLEFSTKMCGYVTEKTGREVSLWSTVFGAPAGTLTYSVRVEGLADLLSTTSKLMEDSGYHARLAESQAFLGGPAVDGLLTPVHGELGDPPPVGSFAMITTATMAGGRYIDAIGWGVEIAQHVEKVSGVPTMFVTSTYGGFGDVGWIAGVADAAAADAADAAINADPDYLTMVNSAGDLFVEASGNQSLITRIA